MSWLIVTPAYNEASRLPALAASLAAQTKLPDLWVVVDDGSTDDTGTCVDWTSLPFPTQVLSRRNSGGLAGGSELVAFRAGVEAGLATLPDVTWIVKVDADLVLDPGFVAALGEAGDVGLIGGVYDGPGEVSTSTHVRGGLRAYSRAAYALSAPQPVALAWDVMDEVAVRRSGLGTHVEPRARAVPSRVTGGSLGLLRGRYRKGIASRWSGYHPAYAALQIVFHLARRPFVAGGLALAWGYLSSGPGPFPPELKRYHRREQAVRLRALVRRPLPWLRAAYGRS